MQNMKKMLILLVGLAAFLCASSVWAASLDIDVPYAQNGDGWWSGLALSNVGERPMNVRIFTVHAGAASQVGALTLPAYSQDTRLLPDFFTMQPYPTKSGGRVGLRIQATGDRLDILKRDFKFTLFVGTDDGFSFQSYDAHNMRH